MAGCPICSDKQLRLADALAAAVERCVLVAWAGNEQYPEIIHVKNEVMGEDWNQLARDLRAYRTARPNPQPRT